MALGLVGLGDAGRVNKVIHQQGNDGNVEQKRQPDIPKKRGRYG